MNIGLLNVKITVQKVSITSDSIGNQISTWEDYYSCWATVSAESPKEEDAAGATWDESAIDFTVRWCSEMAAVNSKEYRVVFNGQLYNIEGIDHMNFKRKAVKLHCRRIER